MGGGWEMGGVRPGAGRGRGRGKGPELGRGRSLAGAGAGVAIDGFWIGAASIWQGPGLWKKTMDQAIENRST